jgi:hypothetical protein
LIPAAAAAALHPRLNSSSLPRQQACEEVVYFVDYTGPAGFVQEVAAHVKRCGAPPPRPSPAAAASSAAWSAAPQRSESRPRPGPARRVVVLDHHKTAAENLADRSALPRNVELDIDMDRCGGSLPSWFGGASAQSSRPGLWQRLPPAALAPRPQVWRHHRARLLQAGCRREPAADVQASGAGPHAAEAPAERAQRACRLPQLLLRRPVAARPPPATPAAPARYVEDGDLWRWQVPGSREFYSGLSTLGLEYDVAKNPSIFDTLLALQPAELVEKVGDACLCAGPPGACRALQAPLGCRGAQRPVWLPSPLLLSWHPPAHTLLPVTKRCG